MKTYCLFIGTLIMLLLAPFFSSSQLNPDSVMLSQSEKWTVKKNQGLFGFAKPEFGPYFTNDIVKLDSAVIKKKTKEGSSIDFELSTAGGDLDQSKYLTIRKTKFYTLLLTADSVSAEAVFAIASVSEEKRQTLFGKLLSNQDEGKDAVLSYNRDVHGFISTGTDSLTWKFMLEGFTSGTRQTATTRSPLASISGGFLKNENDSLAMQLYSSFNADIVLVDSRGEHLAAIAFKQKKPEIWIRKDISESYRHAIATLFAVIISIKDA